MFLCITPLSTVFRAVRFIVGGNRSTQRKPPICRKPLTTPYPIMLHRVHPALSGALTHTISDEREREREKERERERERALVLTQHVAQSHIHTVVNNICLIQRSRPQNVFDQ